MVSAQYPIVADGARYQIIPPFSIRNYQAFNESNVPLLIYDYLGLLREVIGPGGYCAYNVNWRAMSARTIAPTTGKALIIVQDSNGEVKPAIAAGFTGLVISNNFVSVCAKTFNFNSQVVSAPFMKSVQLGDAIVVALGQTKTSATPIVPTSFTDTQGNVYNKILEGTTGTGVGNVQYVVTLYACYNCKAVSTTDSINFQGDASNYGVIALTALDFNNRFTQADASAVGTANPTAMSVGPTGSVSQTSEFAVAAFWFPYNGGGPSNNSLFTLADTNGFANYGMLVVEYFISNTLSGTLTAAIIGGFSTYQGSAALQTFFGLQQSSLNPV